MTSAQIATSLKARKIGKGRWMGRCPAHRERTGSLSITEMGGGKTRLHCFGGCSQRAVLDALGLKWRDLNPDTRIDPEVIRQIKAVENKRQAEREYRTYLLWELRKRISFWNRRSQALGKSMANGGRNDKDFHHALDMERRLQRLWEKL
jgi:hypothetical protein